MVTLKTFHPSWTIYQKKRPDVDSLDLRAVEIQQISGGGGVWHLQEGLNLSGAPSDST